MKRILIALPLLFAMTLQALPHGSRIHHCEGGGAQLRLVESSLTGKPILQFFTIRDRSLTFLAKDIDLIDEQEGLFVEAIDRSHKKLLVLNFRSSFANPDAAEYKYTTHVRVQDEARKYSPVVFKMKCTTKNVKF